MKQLALYYSGHVSDANGRIVRKIRKHCAKSFVKQFMQLLYYWFTLGSSDTTFVMKDSTGASNSMYGSAYPACHPAFNGFTTSVGLLDTAVSVNDYNLASPIANGTGTNQLQYSGETYGAPSSDASKTTIIYTRVFTNNSSASITVKEIGLFAQKAYTASFSILLARDVLVTPITLAVGESLTVNYTVSTAI